MRIAILALLVVFLSKCKNIPLNQEDKAKDSILKYVQNNFHDPKSYESIEFTNIDSFYKVSQKVDESIFKKWRVKQELDSMQEIVDAIFYKSGILPDRKSHDSIIEVVLHECEALAKSPKYKHYKITNKFRSKNSFGALVMGETKYILDSTFIIISAKNQ